MDWDNVVAGIKKYGIRNAAQTTVAPTGTIATVAGCEGYGCEPVFALAYICHVNDHGKDLQLTYASPKLKLVSACEPKESYEQLIRPWKSRLSLFYIQHASLWRDIQLCWLTAVAIVSRARALLGIQQLLRRLGAPDDLLEVAGRDHPLVPAPPPGADRVVASPDGNVLA